jgi:ribosomal protein S18 acetylase RimI-like enzyme
MAALAALMAEFNHGQPMTKTEMAGRLAFLARSPRDELVVAEQGDQVVGFVAFRIEETVYRVAPHGVIAALAVASSHRRAGIGSSLLAYAESSMKEQGIDRIRLTSSLRRKEEAHKFYDAQGYEVRGLQFGKQL